MGLPAAMGEAINALLPNVLTAALFVIFYHCHTVADLALNAVAFAFIGNIDNEFVPNEDDIQVILVKLRDGSLLKVHKPGVHEFETKLEFSQKAVRVVGMSITL